MNTNNTLIDLISECGIKNIIMTELATKTIISSIFEATYLLAVLILLSTIVIIIIKNK